MNNNETNTNQNSNINTSNLNSLNTNQGNNINTSNLNSLNTNQSSDINTSNLNSLNTNQDNNINTSNLNNLNTNKNNNKILIICSIVILLIIIVITILLTISKTKNDSNNKTNNLNENKTGDIIQISIRNNYVLMLDKNSNLYFYGDKAYTKKVVYGKIEKIASKVKYFNDDGRLIIIDNNDDAYYLGLSSDGWGVKDNFEFLTSNVKKISSSGFCFYIIDNNNNYIVKAPINNSDSMKYCALPKNIDGNFSTIASNIKEILSDIYMNGYISNDNKLFLSIMENPGYNEIINNVKNVYSNYIITEDNKLYVVNYNYKSEKIDINLIDEDVEEGFLCGYNFSYRKNNNIFYLSDRNGKFNKLNNNDIKIPYYSDYGDTFIYLNKNNKIVLQNSDTKKELDVSTDSMIEIYNFLKK